MRARLFLAALGLIGCFGGNQCLAQYPASRIVRPNVRSYEQPATSPYLNLLAGPFGYLQGTVPQTQQLRQNSQFRQDYMQTQREIAEQQKALKALKQSASSNLPSTGHVAGFMTHTKYFNVGVPGGQQ